MEAIQEDTIFIMEQYNFNAPINVQIIYEDDEETSKRTITQRKNAQGYKRESGNTWCITTLESNLGAQAQVQTFNEINSNVDNDNLNLVIDNMSAVVEARFKFQQLYKKLSTAELERFKMKYMEMKYLSFKRSMAAAKFLLIPQKHNEIFIRNVIAKIFQKAKVNRNMYSVVKLLYDELIAWTEEKLVTENRDIGAPKDVEFIKSSDTATTLNTFHRKRKYSSDNIQQTNASRKMLRNNTCQVETQSTGQNRYPSFVNNPPSILAYYPSNSTTYYNAPENYLNVINRSNSTISVEEQQNHLSTHTFVANSTIGYQEAMQSRVSQNLEDNTSHLERNAADISRSSISRDSGFMSPELVFSPQDSTNTNYQDPQTTLIKNITSNRRVGSCHVCGTQTDLLCLGCFQIFYCNDLCQMRHWHSHRLRCENITSNFSNSFASNYT